MLSLIVAFSLCSVAAGTVLVNCDNRDSLEALQILTETEISFVNITGCSIYERTLPTAKLGANASIHIQDSWFLSGKIKAGTFRNKSIASVVIIGTDLRTIEIGAFENDNLAMKRIALQRNPNLNLTTSMFRPITFIESLVISDVQVESLPDDFFEGITVLNLTINALGLTSAPNNVLKPLLSSLVTLEISENQFNQLNLEIESQSLRQLYLVGDQIGSVNVDSFIKLPNLEVLSLANNQLSDVDPSWLRENRKLKFVYLHTNRLITLSSDLLNWPIVEKISLSDNFWDCTCELYRLAGQLSRAEKTGTNEFVCFTPDEHKDAQLLDLGGPLCGETTTTLSTTTTTTKKPPTKRTRRTTTKSKAAEAQLSATLQATNLSAQTNSNTTQLNNSIALMNTTANFSAPPAVQCQPTVMQNASVSEKVAQVAPGSSAEENLILTTTYNCEEPGNNTFNVKDNSSAPKAVILLNCFVNLTFLEEFGNVSTWTLSGAIFDNQVQQNGSLKELKSLTIMLSDLLSLNTNQHGYLLTAQVESLVLTENPNLELQANSFRGMNQLTSLKISNSNLKNSIPNEIFVGLPLRQLTLENQALRSVPYGALKPIYNTLEKLILRNNAIRDVIPGLNAPSLTDLDVSGNFIRNIRGNAFSKLPNLQTLSLAANRLSNLDPQLFKFNTRLSRLDISGNSLISLSAEQFKSITLLDLNLRRNPWSCTCQLYRLVKFLPADNTDKINCYWPTGLTLIDVGTKICVE